MGNIDFEFTKYNNARSGLQRSLNECTNRRLPIITLTNNFANRPFLFLKMFKYSNKIILYARKLKVTSEIFNDLPPLKDKKKHLCVVIYYTNNCHNTRTQTCDVRLKSLDSVYAHCQKVDYRPESTSVKKFVTTLQ